MSDRLSLPPAFQGAGIRTSMTTELRRSIKKITVVGYRLTTVLGTLMVVIAALLVAALHYWPPHVWNGEGADHARAPRRGAARSSLCRSAHDTDWACGQQMG